MATPEENIETPAAEPVVEPPAVETVAATVDETSKEIKEGEGKKGEGDLKSTLLISGAVIAVIGAILAIFKKAKKEA
ncbi:hypothetical protein P3S67_014167 [Capsicum chacoense]